MNYRPLDVKSGFGTTSNVSLMPKLGENLLDLPQLLNTDYAQVIINYIPQRYGLDKRQGLDKIYEVAGANPITLLKKFTNDVWIFGYATTIASYTISTDTVADIKTDFSANDGFGGGKYGDYFLVCNGVEKIWRMDNTTFTLAEIAASPEGTVGIKFIGARCYAWYDDTIQYSNVDDGSNPPFNDWDTGTDADEGGTVNYRNAGDVRSVCQLGQYTVGFSDDGFFAFILNTIDSAGTLKKIEVIQNYTEDFGGATGAIETPIGIFYVNEAGLNQMVEVGATNSPYSRQDVLTSNLLGSKYFESADQKQVDLVYDKKQNCIFITLSKDSENNNLVIGYKLDQKAFFRIKGWNINRWAKDGQDIYGASSIKTTVYKCFEGYDDDGLSIGTEYQQELKIGNLWSKNKLKGGYIQGFLSPDSEVFVSYNIYTEQGKPIEDKLKFLWTSQRREDEHAGFDASRFDRAAFDGSVDLGNMVENFSGNSGRISNMQRLIIKIKGGDKLHHIVNWLSCNVENKGAIKRRDMQQIN